MNKNYEKLINQYLACKTLLEYGDHPREAENYLKLYLGVVQDDIDRYNRVKKGTGSGEDYVSFIKDRSREVNSKR